MKRDRNDTLDGDASVMGPSDVSVYDVLYESRSTFVVIEERIARNEFSLCSLPDLSGTVSLHPLAAVGRR